MNDAMKKNRQLLLLPHQSESPILFVKETSVFKT